MNAFVNEMKAMGTWQQVALQAVSDFGRTMTNNGQGTDHAWGGNYFTIVASAQLEHSAILSPIFFGRLSLSLDGIESHTPSIQGGDVRGGTMHGDFPELRTDGPNSISSTGQMLPTTPWEAIWVPLAQWLGVRDEYLWHVMPNMHHFAWTEHLLNVTVMFHGYEGNAA